MKNYQLQNRKINKGLCFIALCLLGWQGLFAQAITYSFANAKMTDGSGNPGTTHYEVDIMLSTDTDFKLGIGQFYITYNTAAFGTNIFGGNLTFNHPAGSETGYILDGRFAGVVNYYGPVLANNTSSRLSITWLQSLDAAVMLTNVTAAGSPHLLAHLSIQFVDNSQDPMIAFFADSGFEDLTYTAMTTASPPSGDGIQLTNDTYDSSGAVLANTWTGTTDTDWDTATNWSLGSVPTGTSNVVVSHTANSPVASGAISVNNMTIASNAALTVNGAVTNNAAITVNSGGSFIAQTSVSGNVTYNRNIVTTNWHLISSPVNGQDIDAFATAEGLASGTGNNRGLSSYNNSTPGWVYYQDGASGTGNFPQGGGRSLKLVDSGDIAFTGTMPVSDVGVSITSNTNGLNLIGNPYPSYIPANINADGTNNILTINSASLTEQTLWFWNQGAGSYDQINQASASRFIAPAQGFFVSSNGNNTFNFTEAMQSHQTDNFQRNTNTRTEILLSMTDGNLTRSSEIYYIDGTTTGWDNGYDSTIFGGANNSFTIYTHLVSDSNGQNLGIQSLPDTNLESMVIPIGVHAASGTTITISASAIHLPPGMQVYIEDRNTGVYTSLDDTSNLSMTLSESLNGIGRFYLHTTTSTLNVVDENLTNISMYTSSKDNLRVVGLQNGEAEVQIFNILGRQVLQSSFIGNRVNDVALPNLRIGVYIVQLTTEKGILNRKIIIQ